MMLGERWVRRWDRRWKGKGDEVWELEVVGDGVEGGWGRRRGKGDEDGGWSVGVEVGKEGGNGGWNGYGEGGERI